MTDTATLSCGYKPTGTITFNLFPTADCSGAPVNTETVTVSGNGTFTTPTGYTPTAAGTYNWTASYTGDASNNNAATACGDEAVTITTCLVTGNSNQSSTTLQAAVDAATAGDTLTVQGTCAGTITVGKDLTLTGQPASGYPTPTLDGNQAGTVLTIGQGATVIINTLTITGGIASGCCGGGISNRGTLTLNNDIVSGNTTTNGSGGGGIGNIGSLTLNSTTVSGNNAPNGGGGGIWSNGVATLNGSTSITGNSGLQGGGIGAFGGTVTLNDTTSVIGNSASGDPTLAAGGGIWAGNSTVTMTGGATITHNSSSTVGGGILNYGSTLSGAVAGSDGNVHDNTPDDIFSS